MSDRDVLSDYDFERASLDPPPPGLCCKPYYPAGLSPFHSQFCKLRPNRKLSDVELLTWRRARQRREEAIAQADASQHPVSPAETWRPVTAAIAEAESYEIAWHDPATCEGVVCDSCNPVDDDPPYDEDVVV